ncbi:MAG: rhamnulokinase [Ruminococcaceae bacterium]|nr:rhamnulokinase [Oscillospiraceae bacterium]
MLCSLAIDIGASGGRHILGVFDGEKITLEEIYRFENNVVNKGDDIIWDVEYLLAEIKKGLKECAVKGKIPQTMAIDTWGVDYVLLDKDGKEILPAIAYRDPRTAKVQEEISKIISSEELYSRTGIQKQNFNTVYQLYCDKKSGKLDKAERFLMIPEYFSYKLTGVMKNEYTNASTTNLLNAETKTWDCEILDRLGIKKSIFGDLNMPGTFIGKFTDEIKAEVGFDCDVVFCPSHDTASAVAACPLEENSVYISSGTWSLIGTENMVPVQSEEAFKANFTNEGGVEYRFRFLKNIMGMWLAQSIRRNVGKRYSFQELIDMARTSKFEGKINPNDDKFTAPENMLETVREALGDKNLPLPDVMKAVYSSLADSYAVAIKEIESISGKTVDSISIVGGGCQAMFLNELTKKATGKKVLAGPVEATATGNIISQFMYLDKDLTLEKARETVKKSFNIKTI